MPNFKAYLNSKSHHCTIWLVAFSIFTFSGVDSKTADARDETVSKFAADVTVHVVLHELAHALVREFDLPILANEETLADAFATYYLTTYLPDRAFDVLNARIKSLMIEAKAVPKADWEFNGEHNHDARRAYQIAALALAADDQKYADLAALADMTENDIKRARDYGTEIHRSWRRILKPLLMPGDTESKEVRFEFDGSNPIIKQLKSQKAMQEMERAIRRFDWHSQVTLSFAEGEGGAGWNRSRRKITVYSEYIARFIRHGSLAK